MSAWGVDPTILVPSLCQCRLSLSSSEAVPSADQFAKSIVYCHPYIGNQVALSDGGHWRRYTMSSFKSVSVPANTNRPFDVFLYYSGGLQLEATPWTNDTTRATALTTQDGILVKSGATGRRYLGTGRTTSVSGQCEDSAAKRFLWNYYNRRTVELHVGPSGGGSSWSGGGAGWGQWNSDSAHQVEVIAGIAGESLLTLSAKIASTNTTGSDRLVGIGQSSTAANVSTPGFATEQNVTEEMVAYYHSRHPARYHYYPALWLSATSASTWIHSRSLGVGTVPIASLSGNWEA